MPMSAKELEIDTLCCNAVRDISQAKDSPDGGDSLFAERRMHILAWCDQHNVQLDPHYANMLNITAGNAWRSSHLFMTINHEIQAALRSNGI